MKRQINIFILISTLLFSSCGTLLTGSKSNVVINSNLTTANEVTIDNKTKTNVVFPYKAKIKNGYKDSTISAKTDGYQPISVDVNKRFNGQFFGNIIFGGLPGMLIDVVSGSVRKVDNKSYYLAFYKDEVDSPSNTTTIINNYTTVENDNKVDDTALESTIIRWYVVSAPAGADVLWRVASSTPEVKNTNQNYLGSTPYESTESFDLTGLTYNNSGNVQIVISCEKAGYVTQQRRFNVRQAIDQKEISVKFNLIKEE